MNMIARSITALIAVCALAPGTDAADTVLRDAAAIARAASAAAPGDTLTMADGVWRAPLR